MRWAIALVVVLLGCWCAVPEDAETAVSSSARARRAAAIRDAQEGAGPAFAWRIGTADVTVALEAASPGARYRLDAHGLSAAPVRGGWSVGLALTAWGRDAARRPLAAAAPAREPGAGNGAVIDRGPVIERWVHGPLGVEQVVVVEESPAGDGHLLVEVAVRGLDARCSPVECALVDDQGVLRARYHELWATDARGLPLAAALVGTRDGVRIRLDDRSAVYPVTIDPLIVLEAAVLEASDAEGGDQWGRAVALSADGRRAILGTTFDRTEAGFRAGSARVFVRDGSGWREEAVLVPVDAEANDRFGASVALSGDGSRALVGAFMDGRDEGACLGGSARVFVRSSAGAWQEEGTLEGSCGQDGRSVALSRDASRALVGAPFGRVGDGSPGYARVFRREGTAWQLEATLVLSGDLSSWAGQAVALSGDGTRALVGSFRHAGAGADAGAARVFVRSGTTWSEEADLVASGLEATDELGVAVALDADGTRAVVGARSDDTDTGINVGTARVFVRSGTAWTEEAVLEGEDVSASAELGDAVAIDADGTRTLIGARYDRTEAGEGAGTVRLFARTGTTWTEEAVVGAAGAQPLDWFGSGVSLSRDGSVWLVGAQGDDLEDARDVGTARVLTYVDRREIGEPCADRLDCATGFCVDGVCCNEACGDGDGADCRACSVAAGAPVDGTCGPLTDAAAPTVVCRAAAGACDVEERCGSTSVDCPEDLVAATGTVCLEGSCIDGTEVGTATCDGRAAGCASAPPSSCAPYRCGPGACLRRCANDDDCVAGFVCLGGECTETVAPMDAGPAPVVDAGVDAGSGADPRLVYGRACSCRVGATSPGSKGPLALGGLVLLLVAAVRRLSR
ncbi:MAG: hypothetical protein ACFCGT_04845 [Sandaracinaceae bacterium]